MAHQLVDPRAGMPSSSSQVAKVCRKRPAGLPADRRSLRDAIREGRYPEGSLLPSETALADTYGATRMTARQAVEVLKYEGLVRSEHGRGVFVRQRPTIRRLARNRFGRAYRETREGAYDVEMRQLGLVARTELVEVGPVVPQRSPPSAWSLVPMSDP